MSRSSGGFQRLALGSTLSSDVNIASRVELFFPIYSLIGSSIMYQ